MALGSRNCRYARATNKIPISFLTMSTQERGFMTQDRRETISAIRNFMESTNGLTAMNWRPYFQALRTLSDNQQIMTVAIGPHSIRIESRCGLIFTIGFD